MNAFLLGAQLARSPHTVQRTMVLSIFSVHLPFSINPIKKDASEACPVSENIRSILNSCPGRHE